MKSILTDAVDSVQLMTEQNEIESGTFEITIHILDPPFIINQSNEIQDENSAFRGLRNPSYCSHRPKIDSFQRISIDARDEDSNF